MKRIEKVLNSIEATLCGAGLLLTIVAVIINIVLDVFFNKGNSLYEELACIGYLWVTYASCGYLYRKHDLMEVAFVVDSLPRIPRYFAEIIREIVIVAFGVLMVRYAFILCEGGIVKRFVSSRIPYIFVDLALVLGFFSQTLSCIKDLVINLMNIGNVFKGTYPVTGEIDAAGKENA